MHSALMTTIKRAAKRGPGKLAGENRSKLSVVRYGELSRVLNEARADERAEIRDRLLPGHDSDGFGPCTTSFELWRCRSRLRIRFHGNVEPVSVDLPHELGEELWHALMCATTSLIRARSELEKVEK
jgi:hypothetical protein